MIVADTNLLAYMLIEGEMTSIAREVWGKDHRWCLPTLWRSEFLNVLSLMVAKDMIPMDHALVTWGRAVEVVGGSEVVPDGEAILGSAVQFGITAYDAHFVVAAQSLGVPLVSSDKELVRRCKGIALSPREFLHAC